MRSLLVASFLSTCVSTCVLAASCTSEDPAPLYLDMAYQLRCNDCTPRVPDDAAHEIMQLDGEAGYHIGCFVSTSGGKKLLTISATETSSEHPDKNFGFKIIQARYDAKDPGAACEVRATEGANTYSGKCTGGAPSAATPCQVTFKVDSGIVNGSVYCDNIPNPSSSPETTRYLVAPFESSKPAKFEVHGCTGL